MIKRAITVEQTIDVEVDLEHEYIGACDNCDHEIEGGDKVYCDVCFEEAVQAATDSRMTEVKELLGLDKGVHVADVIQKLKENKERLEVAENFVKGFQALFKNMLSFFPGGDKPKA